MNDFYSYEVKTKCLTIYRPHKTCKKGLRFSCSSLDLPNRDERRCSQRKGDRLLVGKDA